MMHVLHKQVAGGDPGTVTAFTSLYPALTFAISIAAGYEKINLMKVSGVFFTIIAGICFARA